MQRNYVTNQKEREQDYKKVAICMHEFQNVNLLTSLLDPPFILL